MKKLKIAVWIAVLYILQNMFGGITAINGGVADLLLGFGAAYAFCQRKFSTAMWVAVLCAVLDGTGTGRVFPIVTAMCGAAGLISCGLRQRLRFMPGAVKVTCVTAVMSFAMLGVEALTAVGGVGAAELFGMVTVPAVYTAVTACVIYLILSRTLFGDEDKRLI